MPAANVGDEIRALKTRGYPQKRAVAASLNMERAGKFRSGSRKPRPRKGGR